MSSDLHRELHRGLDEVTPARLDLMRKAYRILPAFERPRILDVGCGRGGPTLALARLSGGEVTGLDIDASALDDLTRRAAAEGLSERVHVVNRSMSAIGLPDGSFDILWSEGSIQFIGFEAGITAWRRFLAPRGCAVVHTVAWSRPDPPAEIAEHWERAYPGVRTVEGYAAEIPRCGYNLLGAFAAPEDFWWENYYAPLDERIRTLRGRHEGDTGALRILEGEQREVDLHRRHQGWPVSAYLVMQRSDA